MKFLAMRLRWIARHHGGLFIGIRVAFPTLCLMENGEARSITQISFGFLVFVIDIEFRRLVKG